MLLFVPQSVAGSDEQDFFPPRVFAVGRRPTGIESADLDLDGNLDLVTSNLHSGFISVLFGMGAGNFEPAIRVAIGLFASDVVAVDLDGDGFQDLAILDGALLIFINQGDRAFAEPVLYYTISSGLLFESLETADVNSDGRPDLIVGGDPMVVYLGNGDGTLATPAIRLGDAGDWFVAPGDFNNDGVIDFATSSFQFSSSVTLWLGNGDGTFRDPIPTGVSGYDGLANDFNGDGRLDLAVVHPAGSQVSILLGTGDGRFVAPVIYGGIFRASNLALADLNQDGHEDLVVTAVEIGFFSTKKLPEASVLLSNGDGTFAPAVSYETPALGGPVTSGDFNGDGRTDVAIASHWGLSGPNSPAKGTLAEDAGMGFTLTGDGLGGLVSARADYWVLSEDNPNPKAVVVDDLNADGFQDLATANSGSDDVTIALGQGDGSFLELGSVSVGTFPVSLVAGYLDSGTDMDLAVANQDSADLSILLGNGDGTFVLAGTVPLGRAPIKLVRSDFDEDGFADLATANPDTDDVSVILGRGDGTFEPPSTVAVGAEPRSLAVVDLNGKDGLDLAVANRGTGDVSILLGNGDGTFAADARLPSGTISLSAIAAADLDGDGHQDLVVAGNGEPSVMVLYGDGQGGIANEQAIEVGGGGVSIAIVDLDGNGRQDLMVTHSMALLSVVLGVEGGFAPRLEFAGAGGGDLAVGEFNRDGRFDLAVTDLGNDSVALLINRAAVLTKFGSDKSTLSWPNLVGYDSFNVYRGDLADLQDFDQDGIPDSGYGDCRNDLDPDLTDNVFVDDEDPLPGDGFFYLMSRVRDGVESDLGETSAGLPRVPSIPCGAKLGPRTGLSRTDDSSRPRRERRKK